MTVVPDQIDIDSHAQIIAWRTAIEAAIPIDHHGEAVRGLSLRLLDGPEIDELLRLGWLQREIWGIASGAAPWRRHDHGLAVGLAWALHGNRIDAITPDYVQTGRLRHFRRSDRAGFDFWWRSPALTYGVSS